jgi:UDP-N-acetyl-D-glucosamine/UDP-N-acetyl-D-galactosamine dehydrogenase
MYKQIEKKAKLISLIGLGYVGLPIALEFAKKFKVIGFDISEKRIQLMKNRIDPSKELAPEAFSGTDIEFTSNPEDLRKASFHIVAVPTPTDHNKLPDLGFLESASETVGKILAKEDYIVFESTVFPGATEEVCVPIIERFSGLKCKQDFKVGYSPERMNPGDTIHILTNVVKVVSGCDEESTENIARVYGAIINAGVYRASSIKVAEAAKLMENTQRDLNIALMNELSIIFNKIGINTFEVLEAATTKWNFLNFSPGLVGGHCIGVDPYYLIFKANQLQHYARVITAGRSVNDDMGKHMVAELVKKIIKEGANISQSRVLVMGITFKENVADIRNSKVADLIKELLNYGIRVDVVDPRADAEEVMKEYSIVLSDNYSGTYDAVIVAVPHKQYLEMTEDVFKSMLTKSGFLFDVKGVYRKKINTLKYVSL